MNMNSWTTSTPSAPGSSGFETPSPGNFVPPAAPVVIGRRRIHREVTDRGFNEESPLFPVGPESYDSPVIPDPRRTLFLTPTPEHVGERTGTVATPENFSFEEFHRVLEETVQSSQESGYADSNTYESSDSNELYDDDSVQEFDVADDDVPLHNRSIRSIREFLDTYTLLYNYEKVTGSTVYDEELCAICLEEFEVGQSVRRLPCFHFFHADCVDEWYQRATNCPVCRFEVTEDNQIQLLDFKEPQ